MILISPFQIGFLPHRFTTSVFHFYHIQLSPFLNHIPLSAVSSLIWGRPSALSPINLYRCSCLIQPPFSLIQWLHSYLLNHSQKVVLNDISYSPLLVTSSVPHGSIFDLLLFIIYVHQCNHWSLLSPQTHLILYADDIFVFKLILHLHVQFPTWPWQHLFLAYVSSSSQLSSTKCKYIFFPTNLFLTLTPFPLTISHTPIEWVSSFRYPDILLSPFLSWAPSPYCYSCSKVKKVLDLLFQHFCANSSNSTLITLYINFVRPILEYCAAIWDPSSPSRSLSLESVQRFALNWYPNYAPLLLLPCILTLNYLPLLLAINTLN